MHTLSTRLTKQEKHAHNEIAAVLSIVPGLGHIYKGHYANGSYVDVSRHADCRIRGHHINPWHCRCWSTLANRVLGSSCV